MQIKRGEVNVQEFYERKFFSSIFFAEVHPNFIDMEKKLLSGCKEKLPYHATAK